MAFSIDTSKPVPGPWRMPNENERRTRVMLSRPWRDCVDVCEVNPDLEEATDATMRVIVAAPDLLAAVRAIHAWRTLDHDEVAELFHRETGEMAPYKDVATRSSDSSTYEERKQAWSTWCAKKNAELNAQLAAALAKADTGRTQVPIDG